MKTLLLSTLVFCLISCEKGEEATITQLEGNWIFAGYFDGQQLNPICSEKETVTLEIRSERKNTNLKGRSFINLYSATANINFTSDKGGDLTLRDLITTEIGGSPTLTDCEKKYYTSLKQTNSFEIRHSELHLIRTPKINDSRIYDTLVFRKSQPH